jgi:hypothetical protein
MFSAGSGARTGDDEDLRAAWRNTLEREGRLNVEGGTVKNLVFKSSDRD